MAEPVHIAVAGEVEAIDLVRALAVRGLPAALVPADGGTAVGLSCRCEVTSRLLGDLFPALEMWVEDRGHAPLLVLVGERSYVLGLGAPVAA